jgi:hypothetical protein
MIGVWLMLGALVTWSIYALSEWGISAQLLLIIARQKCGPGNQCYQILWFLFLEEANDLC